MCARWYTIIAGMSLHSVFFRNGVRRWSCRWSLQTEFVCKCLCDCWYSHWSEHDYYAYVCLCDCVWVCERWERQFWHGWEQPMNDWPTPHQHQPMTTTKPTTHEHTNIKQQAKMMRPTIKQPPLPPPYSHECSVQAKLTLGPRSGVTPLTISMPAAIEHANTCVIWNPLLQFNASK